MRHLTPLIGTNQDGLLGAEELAVMFDGDVDEDDVRWMTCWLRDKMFVQ